MSVLLWVFLKERKEKQANYCSYQDCVGAVWSYLIFGPNNKKENNFAIACFGSNAAKVTWEELFQASL